MTDKERADQTYDREVENLLRAEAHTIEHGCPPFGSARVMAFNAATNSARENARTLGVS